MSIDAEYGEITGYMSLQFHVGGLFDCRPVGRYIHLVRRCTSGTPGPTLCGIDRFAPDSPGFSVGGGVSGDFDTCRACWTAADQSLPVEGALFADLFQALKEAS